MPTEKNPSGKRLVAMIKPLPPPKPAAEMTDEDWRELRKREYRELIAPALAKARKTQP